MIIFLLAVALLVLVTSNVVLWPRVQRDAHSRTKCLSILIPARNEQDDLPACLDAVLDQPCVAEVLVYDDHSEDATSAVVRRYAAQDGRVRLIQPTPLPNGWCGKTYACQKLAAQASQPWILFLDADVRLAQGGAAGILAEAQFRKVTFLSCWPGLEMRSFWEKLLMPMLNFVVLTLYPAPLALHRPDPSLGLAHGALILVRKDVYRRLGGHALVRGALFEDTLLAREWRSRGETSLCLDGQDVVRTRMYSSLPGIWRGFQKNFCPAFRSPFSFWAFLILHVAVFLVPFATLNYTAVACVVSMRVLLAMRFRHPLWSAFLHPLAEGFLVALAMSSWWRYRYGSGVDWKGRRYKVE